VARVEGLGPPVELVAVGDAAAVGGGVQRVCPEVHLVAVRGAVVVAVRVPRVCPEVWGVPPRWVDGSGTR
jgi:hypothetical protein